MISKNYLTVKTVFDMGIALSHLSRFDYFAYDTETTGLNTRKDKIIGISFSGEVGTGFYIPCYYWDKEAKELVEFPDGISNVRKALNILAKKETIMFNASFDIRVTKSNFGIDLTDTLICDAMLLKHTVQEEGDFALKKIAIAIQHELGLNVEEDANKEQLILKENIKANGGSITQGNYELYKADLDIIGEYACADADLTLRVANYFQDKLENPEFFFDEEVMPLYKEVTIPMEERGVKLDMPLLTESYRKIQLDISKISIEIVDKLKAAPEFQSWLESVAEKEYPEKNGGNFAQEYCRLFNLPLPKSEKGKYSITAKTTKMLNPLHLGFLMNGEPLEESVRKQIQLNLYLADNEIPINISSKSQMGDFVFNFLKIKALSQTDKGKNQFDDDMIEHLATKGVDWAKLLSDYNKLIKIKSTYMERFLERQENGYYYFSYKQHGTISGRYGSDAQQLPRPKEEGELSPIVLYYNNLIRSFFISEEGRCFIDCDYESLEPHVFAHVSGDEGLKDIFRKGHDFYSTIAIATERLEGVSADKKADNYLGKVNKPKRQSAKAYSLGVPYGMTDYALGKSLEVSTEEAAGLIEGYLSGFPNLRTWMETSRQTVKQTGKIQSQTGRIRHLPRVMELYSKHKDNLLDFTYRQKLEFKLRNSGMSSVEAKAKVTEAYRDYKNGMNNALNFQIQSLSASVVNRAAIAVNREFRRRGIDAWVCAQIHDQLIFNVPNDKKEECFIIIEDCMTNTTKLSIPLKAPPAYGNNWKDAH